MHPTARCATGGLRAVHESQGRGRWRALMLISVLVGAALIWWVASSPPSVNVVGSDGVWRPRISTESVPRPADVQSNRVLTEREGAGSGAHEFMAMQPDSTDPVTYDPCTPIHVEINPRTGPDNAVRLVRQALDQIEQASGLAFIVDGVSDREVEFESPGALTDPVIISWTDAKTVPDLAGEVVGLGGSQIAVRGSWHWYVTGSIALDGPDLDEADDGQKRAVIMHEIGHVVGLGHVGDPTELMHERNTGRSELGPGDLTGLAALGAGRCIDW